MPIVYHLYEMFANNNYKVGAIIMEQIKKLLDIATTRNASDLHVLEQEHPVLRIDGELHPLDSYQFNNNSLQSQIYPFLSQQQQNYFRDNLTVDFAFDFNELYRVRGNMFRHNKGVGVALRLITKKIPSIESINLTANFNKIIDLDNGLVLITGATGSGKSSTLAALLDAINNKQKKHIITIEDPIEYIHQSKLSLITQKQIKRDTPNYASALESSLREDPDIIMIGEMRDLETIRLAITAAETGHLVFATMHTASAADSIDRLICSFPNTERHMISSVLSTILRAVVSQQLVKKLEGGRVAARELLWVTSGIANLIKEHKVSQITSAMQTGKSAGMHTLQQDIEKLQREVGVVLNNDILHQF